MPRLRRLVASDSWFFITYRVLSGRGILTASEFACWGGVIHERRKKHGFLRRAGVFLPNPWHAIFYPPALPSPVKASFGHRLRQLQDGKTPLDMKPVPQFGAGVFALRERFDRNAYRLMYVVSLRRAPYVLHAFMKKSKSGIGLSKPAAESSQVRLQSARALDRQD